MARGVDPWIDFILPTGFRALFFYLLSEFFALEACLPADAARTGSEDQAPTGRRVLFSATGWHNPPGMGSCKTQLHLIPRDMALDSKNRVTFSPIPEIATTLRVPGSGVTVSDISSESDATAT